MFLAVSPLGSVVFYIPVPPAPLQIEIGLRLPGVNWKDSASGVENFSPRHPTLLFHILQQRSIPLDIQFRILFFVFEGDDIDDAIAPGCFVNCGDL